MESFDYEQVKAKLEALGVVFNDFMKKLNTIDTTLNDNVNVGENGAFQGVVAKALLESWNHCSDRFITFKEEFDILLNSVMQVSNNNVSLEDEVMAMYSGSSFTTINPTSTTISIPTSADTTVSISAPTPVDITNGVSAPTPTSTTSNVDIPVPDGGINYRTTLGGGPTINNGKYQKL